MVDIPWVEKYRPKSISEMALPTAKLGKEKVDLADELKAFISTFFKEIKMKIYQISAHEFYSILYCYRFLSSFTIRSHKFPPPYIVIYRKCHCIKRLRTEL